MLKDVRFIRNRQKKVFSLHRTNFSENSDFAGKSVVTVEKVLMPSKSGQLAGTSRHFLKVFFMKNLCTKFQVNVMVISGVRE